MPDFVRWSRRNSVGIETSFFSACPIHYRRCDEPAGTKHEGTFVSLRMRNGVANEYVFAESFSNADRCNRLWMELPDGIYLRNSIWNNEEQLFVFGDFHTMDEVYAARENRPWQP